MYCVPVCAKQLKSKRQTASTFTVCSVCQPARKFTGKRVAEEFIALRTGHVDKYYLTRKTMVAAVDSTACRAAC